MFGRGALTNLSHLTRLTLRYMSTEDLRLDLELISSIFQTQIHNLRMAREWVVEGQQLVPKPNITVSEFVLVRDYTSKCFMPKYKVDFHVIRIESNKVEVKDNSGKLCWYHISDVKKMDMISKLICQLADIDGFVRKVLIQNMFKILVGHQMTRNTNLTQIIFRISQVHLRTFLDKDLI